MGYATLLAPCAVCKRMFSSNPTTVPSVKNEPVCQTCMEAVNRARQAKGLPAFTIARDAYQPCPEEELP